MSQPESILPPVSEFQNIPGTVYKLKTIDDLKELETRALWSMPLVGDRFVNKPQSKSPWIARPSAKDLIRPAHFHGSFMEVQATVLANPYQIFTDAIADQRDVRSDLAIGNRFRHTPPEPVGENERLATETVGLALSMNLYAQSKTLGTAVVGLFLIPPTIRISGRNKRIYDDKLLGGRPVRRFFDLTEVDVVIRAAITTDEKPGGITAIRKSTRGREMPDGITPWRSYTGESLGN